MRGVRTPARGVRAGMRGVRARILLPLALMTAIAVLSHRALPVDLPDQSDKLAHFAAFGAVAAAWVWALAPRGPLPWRAAGFAFTAAAGWGVLDEVHQSFVPGRHASLEDAAADVSGALTAVAASALWRTRRARRARRTRVPQA